MGESIGSMDLSMILSEIHITPEFFDHLRTLQNFQNILADLDVSDEDQLDLFETLDVDGGGTIDLEELIVGICKLRGDARRSDIVGVSLIMRSVQMAISKFEEATMEILRNHENMLQNLHEARFIAPTSDTPSPCIGIRPSFSRAVCTSRLSESWNSDEEVLMETQAQPPSAPNELPVTDILHRECRR